MCIRDSNEVLIVNMVSSDVFHVEIKPQNNNSDFSNSFNVDWDKCTADWKAELTNQQYFSYVKDVFSEVQEGDTPTITLTATLADATDPDVALEFADTMIRRFSSIAQIQDGSCLLYTSRCV